MHNASVDAPPKAFPSAIGDERQAMLMNGEEFKASLVHEEPPNNLIAPLMAL